MELNDEEMVDQGDHGKPKFKDGSLRTEGVTIELSNYTGVTDYSEQLDITRNLRAQVVDSLINNMDASDPDGIGNVRGLLADMDKQTFTKMKQKTDIAAVETDESLRTEFLEMVKSDAGLLQQRTGVRVKPLEDVTFQTYETVDGEDSMKDDIATTAEHLDTSD